VDGPGDGVDGVVDEQEVALLAAVPSTRGAWFWSMVQAALATRPGPSGSCRGP
jgi:hypothetical protein